MSTGTFSGPLGANSNGPDVIEISSDSENDAAPGPPKPWKTALFDDLRQLRGRGTFATSERTPLSVDPAIRIGDDGGLPIPLPLTPDAAARIKSASR